MDAEDLETLAKSDPEPVDEADGRRRRGNRTRESILQAAADLASVEGLEGLTIGRLATALGMSKSGLFAHFGSKEELQLATIEAARRRFVDHVIRPSRPLPRGRARAGGDARRPAGLLPLARPSPAAASSTTSRPSSTAARTPRCAR